MADFITDHMDIWTSAIKAKSTVGRGSSKKLDLYGIKKLRELILELAVRGKLVPQDPGDEPAFELLKRIKTEKAQQIKGGKIKKQKPLDKIMEDDKPFELPVGWVFSRFGDIYSLEYGNNLPQPKRSETGEYSVFGSNGIVGTHNEFCIAEPCIVVGRKGSAGALNLCFDNGCWVTDVAYSVTPPKFLNLDFVYKQFHTLGLNVLGKGIKPGLSRNEAYVVIVAIPPLNEQHRIVAKVDELMALCDQLESQTEASIDAHKTLVEVLLATLTNAKDADELNDSWQHLSQHFDVLFTTQDSIDHLKQTILQLAVMGKLVKQDPNDEPACKLLERIATEKAQLIKDGKIKKQKPLPPITDEEKPFGLPDGWKWASVGDLLSLKSGYAFKSKYFVENKTKHILATPGNFYEEGGFRHRGEKTKYYDGPIDSEFVFESGDLIIPMTEQAAGLLGSAAFVPSDQNKYLHNQRLGKLSPFSNITTSEFIYLFFNSSILRAELARTCTGMKVRHTSPDRILSVLIPVMSPKEQVRIVARVEELMAICDLLKECLNQTQTTQLHLTDVVVKNSLN